MTELRRAQQWDEIAGNFPSETQDLGDPYVTLSFDLVREEWFELNDGMADNDVKEALDACGDLLKVVSQLCYSLDVDAESLLHEVNNSNFSKFCTTEEDAKKSVHSYFNDERYHNVFYKKVGSVYVIFGYKVGQVADEATKPKVLKGIHYREPFLSPFIKRGC